MVSYGAVRSSSDIIVLDLGNEAVVLSIEMWGVKPWERSRAVDTMPWGSERSSGEFDALRKGVKSWKGFDHHLGRLYQ